MIINEKIIEEINGLAEKYKAIPIQKLANKIGINMTAKQSFSLIIKYIINISILIYINNIFWF